MAEKNIDHVIEDLLYFREEMLHLNKQQELSDAELIDLMGFVNTIILHIANGNKNEERLVNIMGGSIIETESEKLIRKGIDQGINQGIRQGQAKMLIEIGQESGLDNTIIIKQMQEKIGLSLEEAKNYIKQYGKPFV